MSDSVRPNPAATASADRVPCFARCASQRSDDDGFTDPAAAQRNRPLVVGVFTEDAAR
ncbi:hypothetical protein [Nocardia nova]|uniref:hypothetical protein n=1 Tax=Nocardia nova TaxID=37330 RepID=UPI0033F03AF5